MQTFLTKARTNKLVDDHVLKSLLFRQPVESAGMALSSLALPSTASWQSKRRLAVVKGMHWAKTTGMVPGPSGSNLGCSCSFDVVLGCLPIPKQQFIDSLCRMIAKSSEDEGEPGLRVDVV